MLILLSCHCQLQIKFPPLDFLLQFNDDSVKFLHYFYETPDCTITGSSIELLKATFNKANNSLTGSGISIKGDTDVAQDFSALSQQIDIDWEELLAKVTGDAPAHAVGNAIRKLLETGQQMGDICVKNIQEFAQHESNCFPHATDINNFLDKIDTLRHDVERLEVRFNILKDRVQG